MPTPQRPTPGGRPRAVTKKASFSDDDEITPCSSPAPEPHRLTGLTTTTTNMGSGANGSSSSPSSASSSRPASPSHHHHHHHTLSFRRKTSSATATPTTTTTAPWHFDPADGEDMDDSQLWQRMLDIQRTFHCYNSARMSAALLELDMGVDVTRLARMLLAAQFFPSYARSPALH